MTKKIYYEKVGRRYKPVAEYDSGLMDALPQGNHLISVYPGGQSTRYNIDPNYAAMIAAGRIAEDAIADALRQASEMRPRNKTVTEEQQRAWKKLSQLFGDDRFFIEIPSAREVTNAGIKAMQAEADKLMKYDAVKLAFDHFVMVCKLCKESENV